ncbi:mCG128191, isoform CRA_a [Mus musculus]|nr:mCG128191, isoform CRA_a [Mus musculus]EDL26443.1 mCG128191, isoform CRA_a [Mus musculus]
MDCTLNPVLKEACSFISCFHQSIMSQQQKRN